ncbi:MAG: hypothetical protein IJ779_11175 [Ruminococcus sp.]|nr:hypothetical protein [Ruminococcus sp.]
MSQKLHTDGIVPSEDGTQCNAISAYPFKEAEQASVRPVHSKAELSSIIEMKPDC